jgi:hypothetical protein
VLTIAGAFIAATRVNQAGLPAARIDSLMKTAGGKLHAWHPGAMATFDDCRVFFDRTCEVLEADLAYQHESELISADAIGYWIVWSLSEQAPQSEQERGLVRVSGCFVMHSFFEWWTDSLPDGWSRISSSEYLEWVQADWMQMIGSHENPNKTPKVSAETLGVMSRMFEKNKANIAGSADMAAARDDQN